MRNIMNIAVVAGLTGGVACADDAQDAAETSGTESGTETDTDTDTEGLEPLPALEDAPLSTDQTLEVEHPVADEATLDPRVPSDVDMLLADGWGETVIGPGEPILDVTVDGSDPPAAGPNAALVTRFVHLADAQLADDESPARVAALDNPTVSGAFRPQEAYGCRLLNAAVRTVNAIDSALPVDLVVLGGDNIDNAQQNEVEWFQAILDGSSWIECDSGVDDDPVEGPDNDPKDAFASAGLAMPWLWVNGNHDILVQGNFTPASQGDKAIGINAEVGTRDWSLPGGPVVSGEVPADELRLTLAGSALLEIIAQGGDSHGIGDAQVESGKTYYAMDVGETPVRFVVADSAAPSGGAEGVIHQADVDALLRPALDQAEADGKWVIVVTHHASSSLSDGSSFGGTTQDDAITEADWEALLGEYPNVLLHLAGHSHVHRVTLKEPMGGNAYWEVVTSALADHPNQMRLIEVHDEDNGFVSITGIAVDFATDGDPLADEGRALAVTDYTSAWERTGMGELDDRNVRLWIARP